MTDDPTYALLTTWQREHSPEAAIPLARHCQSAVSTLSDGLARLTARPFSDVVAEGFEVLIEVATTLPLEPGPAGVSRRLAGGYLYCHTERAGIFERPISARFIGKKVKPERLAELLGVPLPRHLPPAAPRPDWLEKALERVHRARHDPAALAGLGPSRPPRAGPLDRLWEEVGLP